MQRNFSHIQHVELFLQLNFWYNSKKKNYIRNFPENKFYYIKKKKNFQDQIIRKMSKNIKV